MIIILINIMQKYLEEINTLEYNLLILLNFEVFIDDETYNKYKEQLKNFNY